MVKKEKMEIKLLLIKLYKATLENEKWTNVTELPLIVIITVQHIPH
jgi:hypothetical protein